jgi:polyferredoxin
MFFRTYVTADYMIKGNPVPDFFLRINPLAGIISSAAGRSFAQEVIWWVPLIVLTVILGRAFCGWVCPLGTLTDGYDYLVRLFSKVTGGAKEKAKLVINKKSSFRKFMYLKYYLLVLMLAAALFSVSLLGYLDPLCIMVRSFSFSITPWLAAAEQGIFGKLNVFGYGGTAAHFFNYNVFALLFLLFILFLNRYFRRTWCRTLCPLGALFGILSKISLVKLTIDPDKCDGCLKCNAVCKMGALDFPEAKAPVTKYRKEECIQCYLCIDVCPEDCMRIHFSSHISDPAAADSGDLTRRGIIKALLAGMVTTPLLTMDPKVRKTSNWQVLRPPYARLKDEDFMDLCIRCGMCMQACKTNTLQPAYLEAGIEGLMTPVVKPEIGGCDPHCTACGDVCPTNAIVEFSEKDKLAMKMGTAKLELDRCIGWTENKDCNECVKYCPTQAIKVTLDKGIFKPVKIVSAECNGCAICEKRCREIITNGTACIMSNKGRGMPTDSVTIQKLREQKKKHGKSFLPKI